ncbi:MAG: NarK/NasA family nitrate transporter [Xanthomonadales bacterium]|nr:putative nitrate transporter NarT [Xanthomonadales bacterium]MCC6593015.1 NarK/NasA family nitrate transporter [Xanthomonadales bacterium]MCE7931057.1 NarK/NasA family nitrate transporter [Xanthomonadales bacterium PRO6]
MNATSEPTSGQRSRALWLVTIAFAVCFAVWVIFSIIGVQLQAELGFSETAFGLLVATPILTGSLSRLALGIWSEIYGGRRVLFILMLVVSACTFAVPYARSYPMLLLVGLGLGLAGGAFSVGVVYVTAWYPKARHGAALGLFGMGNSGAALTSFGAPLLLAVMDWKQVTTLYGTVLLVTAALFWLTSQEDPATQARRTSTQRPAGVVERLEPLRKLQVWRFSFYYFLVFGGFVALTSWLPRYYVGAHGLDIKTAGMLTAAFALPAAVFRALGGTLADRFGARTIMYVAFSVAMVCLFLLSYPDTRYVVSGIHGPIEFSIAPGVGQRGTVLFVLGFVMALGAAAVFKHIPSYYPNHVGGVGGLVGMIGGLGGFFLPIAFGLMNDLLGIWTSCFMLLFAIASINLLWMHFAIQRMNRRLYPQLREETDLPEIMHVLSAAEQAQRAASLAAEAAKAAAEAARAAHDRSSGTTRTK